MPIAGQLFGVVLFAGSLMSAGAFQGARTLKAAPGPVRSSAMLRIQWGSASAGFLPTKAYLPVRGHAVTVEFLGTPGAMPRVLADPGTQLGTGRRVLYEDLWKGISLSYTLEPNGTSEATYVLAPSADVANIRVRYNVPIRIQANGTLALRSSGGTLVESSPEAWQCREGARVAIPVSYRASASNEIGFTLGNYDHGLPLTIDPSFSLAAARAGARNGEQGQPAAWPRLTQRRRSYRALFATVLSRRYRETASHGNAAEEELTLRLRGD